MAEKNDTTKLTKRQRELLSDMAAGHAWYDGNDYGRTSVHCNHNLYDFRTFDALRSKKLVERFRNTVNPNSRGHFYRLTDAGRAALAPVAKNPPLVHHCDLCDEPGKHIVDDWRLCDYHFAARSLSTALAASTAPATVPPVAADDADEREQVKTLLITLPAQRVEGLGAISALYTVRRAAGSIAKDKRYPVTERLANLKVDEMGPKEATNLLIELIGKYMSAPATAANDVAGLRTNIGAFLGAVPLKADAPATMHGAEPLRDELPELPTLAHYRWMSDEELRKSEILLHELNSRMLFSEWLPRMKIVKAVRKINELEDQLAAARTQLDELYTEAQRAHLQAIADANHDAAPSARGNGSGTEATRE